MPIHPTIKEIIKVTTEANNLPINKISLEDVRKGPLKMKRLMGTPEPLAKVMNHIIPSDQNRLLMRLYYPEENKSQKAKGKYTPYKTGGHKRAKK